MKKQMSSKTKSRNGCNVAITWMQFEMWENLNSIEIESRKRNLRVSLKKRKYVSSSSGLGKRLN